MKCYQCESLSDFACNCSTPGILVCGNHLKAHQSDKSKKHNPIPLEAVEETSFFLQIRENLKKIINHEARESRTAILKITTESQEKISAISSILSNLDATFKAKDINSNTIQEVASKLKGIHNLDFDKLTTELDLQGFGDFVENRGKIKTQIKKNETKSKQLRSGRPEQGKPQTIKKDPQLKDVNKYVAENEHQGDINDPDYQENYDGGDPDENLGMNYGMNPGMNPGKNYGMDYGMNPGMNSGMNHPGMNYSGMNPGMNSGMNYTGMNYGMNTGMNYGMNPEMNSGIGASFRSGVNTTFNTLLNPGANLGLTPGMVNNNNMNPSMMNLNMANLNAKNPYSPFF